MANEEQIKQAVSELGINVPVMASRMVGNRLELYLYGGSVVSWQPGNATQDIIDREYLESLKVSELKELANMAGVEGYSKMKKQELVNALMG